MNIAIMQPYFFPYLGYFQLVAQSDIFVFHDDVQYTKGSWINRNRILWDGKARWFTFPVRRDDHTLPIHRRYYHHDPKTVGRLLRLLDAAYRHAPHFVTIYPLLCDLFACDEPNIAAFNMTLIGRIAGRLGLRSRLVPSTSIDKDDRLAAQQRVIAICRRLGATRYVNPIGGRTLYDADAFARNGIELQFLQPAATPYRQFAEPAVPDLSIIDVLMFNSETAIRDKLSEYRLVSGRPARATAAPAP